jgi:hypothetical protein
MVCSYSPGEPLNGIIARLSRECGGNVHRCGIVNVTASGVCDAADLPENAVDLGTPSTFQSTRDKPSWLCYDFRDKVVRPTHYTIRSQPDGAVGYCNLRYWKIDGSNDQTHWQVLDQQKNSAALNDKNAIATFRLVDEGAFRYIRLIQTGLSWAGNDVIWIAGFELFGKLAPRAGGP